MHNYVPIKQLSDILSIELLFGRRRLINDKILTLFIHVKGSRVEVCGEIWLRVAKWCGAVYIKYLRVGSLQDPLFKFILGPFNIKLLLQYKLCLLKFINDTNLLKLIINRTSSYSCHLQMNRMY